MIGNTPGQRIITGAVTAANFAGLPIVGGCADYTDPTFADAISQLFAYADGLGAPAVVVDLADDLNVVLNAFRANGVFCTPGFSGFFESGSSGPPCGPIISFEDPPVRALQLAGFCQNLRRNHKFGFGCDAVYPIDQLDIVQHPPVYKSTLTTYDRAADGSTVATLHDINFLNQGYFFVLDSCWRQPQSNIFSEFAGSPSGSIKDILTVGLTRLLALEGTYPEISRHVAPYLVPLIYVAP